MKTLDLKELKVWNTIDPFKKGDKVKLSHEYFVRKGRVGTVTGIFIDCLNSSLYYEVDLGTRNYPFYLYLTKEQIVHA